MDHYFAEHALVCLEFSHVHHGYPDSEQRPPLVTVSGGPDAGVTCHREYQTWSLWLGGFWQGSPLAAAAPLRPLC